MVVAAWRWVGLGCCGLLAAASQTVGDASHNTSAPFRRLQTGPWQVILPYPNPELCSPKECFLRIPASAFPPEMTQHESNDQVEMLGVRYTEVVRDIRREEGLTATERPTITHFINYIREVGETSDATHASITAFDPFKTVDGSWSCDLTQVTGPPSCGNPGPSDACLTWMHIFKVFLFYEEQLEWGRATLPGMDPATCWCAQRQVEGARNICPEEGKCWPNCALVVQTAQPGLEPEWCGPWPGCAEYDPPFGNSYAADDHHGLTYTNVAIFFACGCVAALGCLRAISGYKRRRGAKYEKVPVMDGVELAVDFGDDETENQAGKEAVVPTSG
jgi:hypothetical protein